MTLIKSLYQNIYIYQPINIHMFFVNAVNDGIIFKNYVSPYEIKLLRSVYSCFENS